jgi:hypothetical protein
MLTVRFVAAILLAIITPVAIPTLAKDKGKEKPKEKSIFANRTGENKAKALKAFGGTEESEDAVKAGLDWLVRQQMPDGRWKLDGNFRDKGTMTDDVAATGLALLPLLGAGYTHKMPAKGEAAPYVKAVQGGLTFLTRQQQKTGQLSSANYSHGIASQALCEAYGMTKDPALKNFAQFSVAYIVNGQHDQGGWRYASKQPGDVSVTGWQIMALFVAQRSGLVVPKNTLNGAVKFLDSCCDVTTEGYSYLPTDNPSASCTAIGLLCRQHLQGWNAANPRVQKAVKEYTPAWKMAGNNAGNCYMQYYVTQALFHLGGDDWKNWNESTRDTLIKAQESNKDRKDVLGSWTNKNDMFGRTGGRLMQTSLNVLMLESYYRYLPAHGKDGDE